MAIGLRFRRGDTWQPARLRNLGSATLSVATPCPPRSGDRVDVELREGATAVRVSAVVVGVTPPEAAAILGASGFGARFAIPDRETQLVLAGLATRFEEVGVVAPPPRRDPRYPVRWPIEVAVEGPDTVTPALDISERGLFIASGSEVGVGTPTGLVIRLENGDPVHAGACVTRQLSARAAGDRGTSPGFGVEITAMRPGDARRYRALVARVARRSRHHVAVWGPSGDPLAVALTGVGYVVSRLDGVRALLSVLEERPSLVVLCGVGRASRELATLTDVIRHRGILALSVTEDDPRAVRGQVDALLISKSR